MIMKRMKVGGEGAFHQTNDEILREPKKAREGGGRPGAFHSGVFGSGEKTVGNVKKKK